MIEGDASPLKPPIMLRTELFPGGVVRQRRRGMPGRLPAGAYHGFHHAVAYMYLCPITKNYVVAAQADVGGVNQRIVCYQTFRDREAAIMYAMMCGG